MRISRKRLLTGVAAAILYAGPLIYLDRAVHEAHFVAVSRSRPGEISVLDYGAKADGVTDDGPAFEAAFSDAWRHDVTLAIPRGTYLVNRELEIHSGMIIRSEGATLKHTDGRISILSAVSADGWVLEGPLTLVGTRDDASPQGAENGLSIAAGSHFIVDKLTVTRFRGSGIRITSGRRPKSAARGRGNHGQFAFVSLIGNNVGLEIEDGTGAEYNLFTLLSFSDNGVATRIAAGNTIVSTANVVDNMNGVDLVGGTNDGHGIFSAANINHNAGFNIRSVGVSNGFTFNACHVRADSPSHGTIELSGSYGIHVSGGDVDARILDEGGGTNLVADNFIAGPVFGVSRADAAGLRCVGLFGRDGLLSGDLARDCGR
ncbi:MAG: hypothetical protein IRY99_17900 [Isosphaeraceae bacterium]|nr:hypothetical protein [Isosphaeraceae bacterium]